MTEIEYELKFLLPEVHFLQLVKSVESRYPNVIKKDKIQINYYFDSLDNYLNKNGITCRIRQIGSTLVGQIKQHCDAKTFASEEINFDVADFPQEIEYKKHLLVYQGNLVTMRSSYQIHPKLKIECDINYYLGHQDFEVEIEYESNAYDMARQVAHELGLENLNLLCKSERFFQYSSSNRSRIKHSKVGS